MKTLRVRLLTKQETASGNSFMLLKEKPEIFKKTIKDTLKKEGKIKDSTKELTVEQLANEIIRLKNYKNKLNGKN